MTEPLVPRRRVAGKYTLLRRLATGGMGEVWLARNEATAARVALKTLRRTGSRDGEALAIAEARFRHEARVSAALSHPHVVRVFDLVEEDDGTLVLVMEHLRGESLERWLARVGPRSTREALAVMCPILSALELAHRAGIVHRDVTPANVILAFEAGGVVPKLVDFGIARPSGPSRVQTLEGMVLGTPRYVAPEQIRGGPIDGRADVFGAAVVVYETITGISPFAGRTPSAELAAVLEGVVDPDSRIEPRAWLELQRALSKRPYERHASAGELAAALQMALGETDASLAVIRSEAPPPVLADLDEGEPSSGPVTLGVSPTRTNSRRNLLLGALALGAVAASGLAIGLRSPPHAPPVPAATVVAAPPASPSVDGSGRPGTAVSAASSASTAPVASSQTFRAAVPPGAPARPRPRPVPVATTPGF